MSDYIIKVLRSFLSTSCFFFTRVFSLFFKQIVVQLLYLAEEREMILPENVDALDEMDKNGALFFVGEMFSRICRRGYAGK